MMKIFKFLTFLLLIPSLAFGAASGEFDGADDYVDFGDLTILDGATSYSISAYYVADVLQTSDRIVSKWGSTIATAAFILSIDDTSSSQIITGSVDDAGVNSDFVITNGYSGTTGVWQQVISSWINATPFVIYKNTSSVSLAGGSLNQDVSNINNIANPIRLGINSHDLTGDFDGRMAYVSMYKNINLTEAQRKEIFFKPEFIPEDRVGLWFLWGDASEKDFSGNNNSGTINGNYTGSSDGPPVMFGGGLPL